MWGGCSDALKKRLNSLLRRARKLVLPDKNLTTDQKLNKRGILSLHKQLDYNNNNKNLFIFCIGHLPTMCQCTYLACTKLLTLASGTTTFSYQSQEQIYSKQAWPFRVPCCGIVFQCTSDHVTHSAPSRETSVSTLTQPHNTAYPPPPPPPIILLCRLVLAIQMPYHRLSHH